MHKARPTDTQLREGYLRAAASYVHAERTDHPEYAKIMAVIEERGYDSLDGETNAARGTVAQPTKEDRRSNGAGGWED